MVSAEKLKSIPLFKACADAALTQLASDMTEKTFPEGDVIIKEGESSGAIYFVVSGRVAITKNLKQEDGGQKVVARLEGGEFFGEMSFLENQPHSADAVAQEEVAIYVLPRKSLDDLFKKNPQMALDNTMTLLSGVSSRLRQTTNELVTVSQVSRIISQPYSEKELLTLLMDQMEAVLPPGTTAGFYIWNMFNEEYDLVTKKGPIAESFPASVASEDSLKMEAGQVIASRSDMKGTKEGLFVYHGPNKNTFTSGNRQLIETISDIMAPAIEAARAREEEASRKRLEQTRQQGYSI